MNETDLRDLADYHTELWHKRSGWVATERSVTPSVQLFKIGYFLGMDKLKEENARLREALESISKNTCCEPCQEAKKVAINALKGSEE